MRQRFGTITDRFADFQAQCPQCSVDFPLLQRLALPVTIGAVSYPGIRIQDTRIIRLLEVLLHDGNMVGGWIAKEVRVGFEDTVPDFGALELRKPNADSPGRADYVSAFRNRLRLEPAPI